MKERIGVEVSKVHQLNYMVLCGSYWVVTAPSYLYKAYTAQLTILLLRCFDPMRFTLTHVRHRIDLAMRQVRELWTESIFQGCRALLILTYNRIWRASNPALVLGHGLKRLRDLREQK